MLGKESPQKAAAPAARSADMPTVLGEDYRRRDVLARTGAVPAAG
ncbi:hypothetical protein [Streptomyces nojiriensis]